MPSSPISQTPPVGTDATLRLSRFQGFLSQDPSNMSLRSQTVAAAIAAGEWSVADELIKEGLRQSPEAPELLAHAGFVALKNQDYAEAKQRFASALSQGLNADTVRYNLAFAQFYSGEYASALITLESLASDSTVSNESVLLTARCLHHLQQHEQAIGLLEKVAARSEEAEGLLALLLHEVNRSTDALAAANRVLSANPTQLDALLARAGTLVEREDFEQALLDYKTATQAHPMVGRAWSGLAQLQFRDFKFDEALASLKTAVTYMPDHIGTWHTLAWIHIMQGNADLAKHAFDCAYDIDRNFGETHGGLAVVAAMQDQPKLAEEHIKRAKRLNPEGFAAHYASMLLLEKQGKQEDARLLFNKVMSMPNASLGMLPSELVQRRMQELAKKTAH